MRTLYPVTLIIALAVSVMIIQMSGLPAILMGGNSMGGITADDDLEEGVNNSDINASGAPGGSDSGGFFQFVVGGAQKIVDFAVLVVLLPETLNSLDPIPRWFAYPVGVIAEGIVIIGIAEMMSQREWT